METALTEERLPDEMMPKLRPEEETGGSIKKRGRGGQMKEV